MNAFTATFLAGALSALALPAFAQTTPASSVTLFGVVDVNLRYIKNGDNSVKQVGTDGYSSSRLGFRGIEDLGNGLSAGFWLEAALNPDDGTTRTKFWHRRSTVSLLGGFGEVRLGRDFTPTYLNIADYDAFGDNGVASFSKIQSSLTSSVQTNTRADNEVSWILPKDLGGVYGQLSAAAGEGVVGGKYLGGRLGYRSGPLNVSGSYGRTDASAAEDKFKIATIGGGYDFGPLRLLGVVSQTKFVARKQNLYLLGATAPVGGAGLVRLSIGRADLSGGTAATATADADDATLLAAGYVHNLSKRTALYGTAVRISNKGSQRFAALSTPVIGAGQKSTGVEAGLRHSF